MCVRACPCVCMLVHVCVCTCMHVPSIMRVADNIRLALHIMLPHSNCFIDTTRWPSGLDRWLGLATGRSGRVRIPLRQRRFGLLAIPFTSLCHCLSEETLKAVGPFYLVSMPGEVKKSDQSALECVTVVDSTTHSKPPPLIVALAYCPV